MSDNLDPEIAELLGLPEEKDQEMEMGGGETGKPIAAGSLQPIDMSAVLGNKNHYPEIIAAGGEHGSKLHELISNFLRAKDKDEKSMNRERLVPAYWNMLYHLVDDFFEQLTPDRESLYRYGLLNASFINDRQQEVLTRINQQSTSIPEVLYVDEWLYTVGNGKISPSSVDETKKAAQKKKGSVAVKGKLERKSGAREAEIANLKQKVEQHTLIEQSLKSSLSIITQHEQLPDFGGIIAPYTTEQKKAISEAQDILKNLQKSDREIEATLRTLRSLEGEIKTLRGQGGEEEDEEVDTRTVKEEFSSLRQMTKMTVGRQGNHFPFLFKPYMPESDLDVCSRENLISVLEEVERIDPGVFKRTYKGEEHRILPYFIIVPSYGDSGICWEPFDRRNRGTGKGRIAMPLFPRDLKAAVLSALADMRWQMAKEKALHYWMEEGLTGYYYQWAQENKVKGDLKDLFVQDYILWIKFEAQGMQKLSREVRSIFWRYIPFPQEIKETLKNRGFYYQELYKKDQNRAASRGY
jgi:hypothetical protein